MIVDGLGLHLERPRPGREQCVRRADREHRHLQLVHHRTGCDRLEAVGRAHDHQHAIAAAELVRQRDRLRLVGGRVAFDDLDLVATGQALLVRFFERQAHAVLDRHAAEREGAAGGVEDADRKFLGGGGQRDERGQGEAGRGGDHQSASGVHVCLRKCCW
jgi:hypothetical protein